MSIEAKVSTFRRVKSSIRFARLIAGLLILGVGLCLPSVVIAQSDGQPFTSGWTAAQVRQSVSAAWGDYDADGDLDLAVGNYNEATELFQNIDGILLAKSVWASTDSNTFTQSIAWGDVDNDGDLDLVTASYGAEIRLYRNDAGVLPISASWVSDMKDRTVSIAWGDYDGDGDFDLVAGNQGQVSRLYRNDHGALVLSPDWSPAGVYQTSSVAWADFDQDGDLDLAMGASGGPGLLFGNDGGKLTASPIWSSAEADRTNSVAWGDLDGDSYPELAMGNDGTPTRIYHNLGGQLAHSALWSSVITATTNSVAWGDHDADGDPDLAVGIDGAANQIYRNNGGILSVNPVWSALEPEPTQTVLWGDYDGDADLDLVVVNKGVSNHIYRNDVGVLPRQPQWWSETTDAEVKSLAWGDVDGDGDLDLAVGASGVGQHNHLYRNDRGALSTTGEWASQEMSSTTSVAWGDYDGDGDLDLAAGNFSNPVNLYRNDGGALTPGAIWSSAFADQTKSVAWGDVDGDGDLDLATGNQFGPNRLYRNDGHSLSPVPVWSSHEISSTVSVAWGDYDDDGDLDLAAGNMGHPSVIYRNEDGALTTEAAWATLANDATVSVAWGDFDGDGDLDLATGNYAQQPNRIYRNDNGLLTSSAVWSSAESDWTASIAWGDYDGDGDLDLAAGNEDQHPLRIYRNDRGALTRTAAWSSQVVSSTVSVAWGDYDADGDLDLAMGNDGQPIGLFINRRSELVMAGGSPLINLDLPGALGRADYYASPAMWQAPALPITYTIHGRDQGPAARVIGFASLDGGGRWHPVTPFTATAAAQLVPDSDQAAALTANQVYTLDMVASAVVGQARNAMVRLVALPSLAPRPNGVPGPYWWGSYADTSFPFGLHGAQVRVVDDSAKPMAGAVVYRIPQGSVDQGVPLTSSSGSRIHSDALGFVQVRDALQIGDRLFATAPISVTPKYTIYATNGQPTEIGLDDTVVTASGMQTLTVSAGHPLMLLNLSVALEWDAANDEPFQIQLVKDLQSASAALYDWTNGEVALGEITVYQSRVHWDDADIRIYASNQLRPSADRGGIVTVTQAITSPLLAESIVARPGVVRIGAAWNRYGSPEAIGDDWPRALAHELAHYALFLEDTYLGLDASNRLTPVESCTETAMSDPYDDVSSEFRFDDGTWQVDCGATLAELPEWSLLTLAYAGLLQPPPPPNSGPSRIPYAITNVQLVPAPPDSIPLIVHRHVDLTGVALDPAGAHGYLIRNGRSVIDLGEASLNGIEVRGAREGDELCLFGRTAQACAKLQNVAPPDFVPDPLWQPALAMTPINTTTVQLAIHEPGGPYQVALYSDGNSPQNMTLLQGESVVVTLTHPGAEVSLDVTGPEPRMRLLTTYVAGSGPGRARSHDSPLVSGDGQVVLLPPTNLHSDAVLSVQTAVGAINPPPGRVAIGQVYRIASSDALAQYEQASISFQYLGMAVLLAHQPEENLTVYYRAEGSDWTPLPSARNLTQNIVSAAMPGPGVYALMSGLELRLPLAGWNPFGYPVQDSRPVTVALASIAGQFKIVYGFDGQDSEDPWQVYAEGAPEWVNDLRTLEFAKSYLISVTQAITLYLADAPVSAAAEMAALPDPPATYYGVVQPDGVFTPTAELKVVAWVGESRCGQTTTRQIDGAVVYAINVVAANSADPGCGAPGRTIRFAVGERQVMGTATWNNDAVWELSLGVAQRRLYLPVIEQTAGAAAPTPSTNSVFLPAIAR